MRHSSQARVTRRAVYVPHDVLRPLFIDDGSFAYGLYHPPARTEDTGYEVITSAGHAGAERSSTGSAGAAGAPPPSPEAGRGGSPATEPMPTSGDKAHKGTSVNAHDFVFTAIPPRLWPIVAYLEIYVADRPKAMQEISEALDKEGVNILYGECAREGRTNAVWSAIISFENLRPRAVRLSIEERQLYLWRREQEGLTFPALIEELHGLYRDTALQLGKLVGHPVEGHPLGVGSLRQRWGSAADSPIYFRSQFKTSEKDGFEPHRPAVLPEFAGDAPRPYPPKAVSGHVLYELQYFHERAARRVWHEPANERHRPFRVACREPARLELGQTGRALLADEPLRDMVPTYGVAVMVPEQGFLRLSLIPPTMLSAFRRIEIRYTALLAGAPAAGRDTRATREQAAAGTAPGAGEASAQPSTPGTSSSLEQSSKGLLAAVTRVLGADVQIWRVINHTHRLRNPERGRLVLLVQYVGPCVDDEKLRGLIEALALPGLRLFRPVFKALAPVRLFVSHRSAWVRWPEIRALLLSVAGKEGVRDEDVVIVESGSSSLSRTSGPVTVDQIRDSLRACDAMIQFGYREDGKADASGEWLGAEFLAAHCLDLPIAVLNRPGAENQDVLAGVTYFAIPEAAPRAEFEQRIREALQHLIRRVRQGRMSTRESASEG